MEEHDTPGQEKTSVGWPKDLPRSQEAGNWRLRSQKLQNGYVIEVRSREEIGSFERFCGALRTRKPSARSETRSGLRQVCVAGQRHAWRSRFPTGER